MGWRTGLSWQGGGIAFWLMFLLRRKNVGGKKGQLPPCQTKGSLGKRGGEGEKSEKGEEDGGGNRGGREGIMTEKGVRGKEVRE